MSSPEIDPSHSSLYQDDANLTLIDTIQSWADAPRHHGLNDDETLPRIRASRRTERSRWTQEHGGDPHYATVAITLQPTEVELFVDGQCIFEGDATPGMVHLVPAGSLMRATFRCPSDLLQLHVPSVRLQGILQAAANFTFNEEFTRPRLWAPDKVVERLAWLLLRTEELDAQRSELYIDGIAQAIVARLLEVGQPREATLKIQHSLPKWRLKRVVEFIDTNLSRPLKLTELATCVGLSRTYFAAQFRASTGFRPHDYVIQRRIRLACEILRKSEMPLVEVALTVGFQTQAHFTTVFRRVTGETPGRWRQLE